MRTANIHRLRRATAALVTTILAGTIGPVLTAAPASAAISDTAAFTLTYTPYSAAGAVDMVKASMTSVIEDGLYGLVYRGTQCAGARASSTPISWFCFDDVDVSSWRDNDASNAWIPQGVSTVSDALDDESWNGRSATIITWYHKGGNGVRISVINQATGEYRHVLLVNPYYDSGNHASYRALNGVHAGGLLWYGRYLFVPDTGEGLRVFSMDHIYDLGASTNGTTSCSYIGFQSNTYCGAQYKYVMPQVGIWRTASPTTTSELCVPTSGKARFSYLTVDRPTTPDRLIVGEFCEASKTTNGRLAAYPMATAVPSSGASTLTPSKIWQLPSKQIQGAAYNGIYWYFNKSAGSGNGILLQTVASGSTFSGAGSRSVPIGPEDLSIWRSTDQIWSVTEYNSAGRMLYSMPTNF